tara:strand:- start:18977 stop:19174 length:198 start_codon:yes stop_codon:yes gene_type:complete
MAKTKKTSSKQRPLTERQKATLKRHSVHHSSKHMTMMKKLMQGSGGKKPMTFTEAHKRAQKAVGT